MGCFEENVVYEIRQLRDEIKSLQKQVFENKLKLTVFIATITVVSNIIIFVAASSYEELFHKHKPKEGISWTKKQKKKHTI